MTSITLWSWIFIFQLLLVRPGFAAPVKHDYEVLVRRAASRVFIRDEYSVSATKSAIILAVSVSASVMLFACLLGLFIVFRRSQQKQVAESEGGDVLQRSPWWAHESKNEKSGWWWASPKLSPTKSTTSLETAQDLHILPHSADHAQLQIPAPVLDAKPPKATPQPRIAIARAQRCVGVPRSPAGRKRNWGRHPLLPPKTPVEVLFAVDSKSRASPPHRRPAPPAPLKLREQRPRKTNKVQRLALSPFPVDLKA